MKKLLATTEQKLDSTKTDQYAQVLMLGYFHHRNVGMRIRSGLVVCLVSLQLIGCPSGSGVRRDSPVWRPAAIQAPVARAPEVPRQEPSYPAEQAVEVVESVSGAHDALKAVDPENQSCTDCLPQNDPVKPHAVARSQTKPGRSEGIDEELLNELVDQALSSDQNCRKVFTGNGWSARRRDPYAGYEILKQQGYAKTFARAFAQDLCQPISAEVIALQTSAPGPSNKDALARTAFNRFLETSPKSGDQKNLAATYALSYSLGLRESGGNFSEGRDRTARNTSLLTEEAGAFQVSSNTLDSIRSDRPQADSEGVVARRQVFAKYLDALSSAQKSEQSVTKMAEVCDIRDSSEMPQGNSSRERMQKELQTTFGSGGSCAQLADEIAQNSQRLGKITRARGRCFMTLQKRCPSFAVKYNTVTVRTRADHFGPLKHHGRAAGGRPTIEPQCRGLFDLILARQDQVCRIPRAEPAASAVKPVAAPAPATAVSAGAPAVSAGASSAATRLNPESAKSEGASSKVKPAPEIPEILSEIPRAIPVPPEESLQFIRKPVSGGELGFQPGQVRGIEQAVSPGSAPGNMKTDIVFGDARQGFNPIRLQIEAPDVECPKEFTEGPGVCFHGAAEAQRSIVLDPGHSDFRADSSRNGFHDEIHEGQANMVVALLTRQLLLKCAPYSAATGKGIQTDALRMSHYPGERGYGDFEQGYLGRRRGLVGRIANHVLPGNHDIASKGGNVLLNHINKTISYRDQDRSNSVVVSIHADAPDLWSSRVRRNEERPLVFVAGSRAKSSKDFGELVYDKLFKYTAPFYAADQLGSFVPQQDDGRDIVIDRNARAAVMLSGSAKAEVVLAEGFHMDGKVVGERIQRELHDCLLDQDLKPVITSTGDCVPNPNPAPVIQATFYDPKDQAWVPVQYEKTEISRRTFRRDGTISYASGAGTPIRGLKVSRFYQAYAQALAAGVAERYACGR